MLAELIRVAEWIIRGGGVGVGVVLIGQPTSRLYRGHNSHIDYVFYPIGLKKQLQPPFNLLTMYRTQIFSILLTISHYALLVQCQQRICPIRQCRSCLNPALQSAPGIGFHLGLTSGCVKLLYISGIVLAYQQ